MQRLVLFFALLVAAVLASSTCEQKITEAKLFINGEAQAKKCPHFVTNMMLSSFGVKRFSHAGVVLDIFNRPKANLLVIKDQTANDCAMNYDVKKMLNKYYARFASEQPFVVSMALSQADAERPVLLALTNNNVFSIYQDQSFLVNNKKQQIAAVQESELETMISALKGAFALKSEQGRTPDMFLVTLKQDVNAEQLFKVFAQLYEKTIGEEITVHESQGVASRKLLSVQATPGFNATQTAAFWLDKWVANNFTAPSNYTQMDADMADWQTQVWVWVFMILGFLIAFLITGSINFSRDAMEYSVSDTGSDD